MTTTAVAAVGPGEPATGVAVVEPTRSLPVPLSSFVGREREMADGDETSPEQRAGNVIGTGGVGKTRLAINNH